MKCFKNLLLRSILAVVMMVSIVSSNVNYKEVFASTPMIYGHLVDERTNNPISDATVIIGGIETQTDSNGYYELNVPIQGTFNVLAYVQNYEPYLTVTEVNSNGNVQLDMDLSPILATSFSTRNSPLRIVTGIVRDVNVVTSSRASILVGARVSDTTDGVVNPATDVTDSLGSYRLLIQHDVRPVNFKGEMSGFSDYNGELTDLQGIVTVQDIYLDNRTEGIIEVTVENGDQDTLVFLNNEAGVPLGQENTVSFNVNLGQHTIRVYANGNELFEEVVTVNEFDFIVPVNVELQELAVADDTQTIVSGIVTDENGVLIPNFQLIIGGEAVQHNDNGYYIYTADAGTYSTLMSSNGYLSQGQERFVFEDVVTVNYKLELNEDPDFGLYVISGIATNQITGERLADISVENVAVASGQQNTRTDDNGYYVLTNIPAHSEYRIYSSSGNISVTIPPLLPPVPNGVISSEDLVIDLLLTNEDGTITINIKDNIDFITSETEIYLNGVLVDVTDTGDGIVIPVVHGDNRVFVFNSDYVAESRIVNISSQNRHVTVDFTLRDAVEHEYMSVAQILVLDQNGDIVPGANLLIGSSTLTANSDGYLRYVIPGFVLDGSGNLTIDAVSQDGFNYGSDNFIFNEYNKAYKAKIEIAPIS